MPRKRRRFLPAKVGQGAGCARDVERQDLRVRQFEIDRLGCVGLVGQIDLALRPLQGLHGPCHVTLRLAQMRLGHQAIRRDFDLERGVDGRVRIGQASQAYEDLGQVSLQFRRVVVECQGPLQLGRRVLPALLLFIEERPAGVLVGTGTHRTRDDAPVVDQLGNGRWLGGASPQACRGQGKKRGPGGSRSHTVRLPQ